MGWAQVRFTGSLTSDLLRTQSGRHVEVIPLTLRLDSRPGRLGALPAPVLMGHVTLGGGHKLPMGAQSRTPGAPTRLVNDHQTSPFTDSPASPLQEC